MSNVLSTVHVCIRHRTTLITDVQTALNTVHLTLTTTARTRLRRITLRHSFDRDAFHLGFVLKHRGEAVEGPRVQVKVAVLAPVFRLAVLLVLADAGEVAHHNRSNTFVYAPLDDVLREGVKVVGATSRLLLVQPRGLLGIGVLTASNPFAEVVVILLQTVQRVQFAVTVFVGERGEVIDTEVNTHGLLTGCFSNLDFNLAHEVEFPLVTSPDHPHLLDVLHGGEVNVRPGLIFAEDEVRPIFLEIRAF